MALPIDFDIFTPTERRLMDVLKDGQPHFMAELMRCLDDDMAEVHALRMHIQRIRGKLPSDHTVLCQFINNQRKYRWVRLLG